MKQIHKSRQVSRVCILTIIITLYLCPGIASSAIRVNQTIAPPTISIQKIPLQSQTQKNKTTTIGFPDINFEISSTFYTHNGTLAQNQIYDKQMYTDSVSQYCDLYKSSVLVQTKSRVKYNQQVSPLKYALYNFDDAKGSNFYMLGSDSFLYIYGFDKDNIKTINKFNVDYNISRVRDGELDNNVELFVAGNSLFIANNDSLWILNPEAKDKVYFKPVAGFEPIPRIVSVGLARRGENDNLDKSMIWVCGDRRITVFTFSIQNEIISLTKSLQYSPISQAISTITYNIETEHFYLTAGRSLHIFKFGNPNQIIQYQVYGLCTSINLIKTTLFLGCEYERINFITQLRIQDFTKLVLNRYYDDQTLEGIRDVQYLGSDRMALIGDEQAIIIGEAVNRNTLLDLADRNTEQNYEYAYSFSLQDLYYIPHYSTPQHSIIFVVGDNSISVHKLTFEPPEIQCNFGNNSISSVSALIVFNTSHCPFLVDSEYQLNGTFSLCQSYFPLKIEFAKRQYEEKTAKFIFFVIMLIGIATILICAGFGIKIRNRANVLIEAMRNKIEKVRRQHENSEMKKL